MSDDKRHAPTPSRIAKAKREGKVARSAELTSLAAFAAALAATCAARPALGAAAAAALRSPGAAAPCAALLLAAFAPAAAAAGAAVALAVVQGGLHPVALTIDLKRLHPGTGVKRMVGGEALVGAVKATLGLVLATGIVLGGAVSLVAASAAAAGPMATAQLAWGAALRACLGVLALGALMALADVALTRRRWLRGLRMSHDELKRDARENDGDPHVRGRRRRLHHAFARSSVERTRDASFVLVNPTHIAIALRYAPPEIAVPQILVRAAGDAALRVRAIARERGIPVVAEIALARALFRLGDAGEAIPPETYVAVAQVVASLIRERALA